MASTGHKANWWGASLQKDEPSQGLRAQSPIPPLQIPGWSPHPDSDFTAVTLAVIQVSPGGLGKSRRGRWQVPRVCGGLHGLSCVYTTLMNEVMDSRDLPSLSPLRRPALLTVPGGGGRELSLLWTAQGFGAVSVSSGEGEGTVIQTPLAILGFPSSSSQCHPRSGSPGFGFLPVRSEVPVWVWQEPQGLLV